MRLPLIVNKIRRKVADRVNAKILGIFLTHQMLVISTGFVAKTINVVPKIKDDVWTIILNNLNNWDGRWYLRIVSEGYNIKSAAFFPLFPLLIKILSFTGIPPEWAGILISNGAFLITCFLFYYLVRLDFDENIAIRSLWYMVLFPTAFYFNAIYTESLFLALVLAAFILARKQCWPAAALAGLLASATRNTGVLLVVPMAIIYLNLHEASLKKIRYDIGWLALVPLGLLFYMYYLAKNLHDPLAFVTAQHFWSRTFSLPWDNVFLTWQNITHNYFFTRNLIDLSLTSLVIIACVIGRAKLRPEYAAYLILGLVIPLTSKSPQAGLFSMPRFLLVLFPIYIMMANLFKKDFCHNLLFNLSSGFLICLNLMFAFSRFVA